MRRTILLAIATLVAASPAWAAKDVPFPRFNTHKFCEGMVIRSEGTYASDDCKADERVSEYDARMQWDDLSITTRGTCQIIANQSGQSYFVLSACLAHFDPRYQQGYGQPVTDRTTEIAKGFRR